ncbi:L-amino acid N-acyltransferase YncA [Paenibacillus sp. cl6col]|uniref:GNAT family N-acetyltransferase n=1 Tax=Paenibacillus alvei TaxID=44250 RepID=A0ABT4EFU3_PAEAL|nr:MULTISPECIES: GNAT family N-acetyltransferase [Paenibacillus]MCY9531318.1 GNAT family N-acetyltransferase [Paenibacillus alvei]SDE96029.1 L-amino acid N-acyltransferase YncA [Paenibacillus sp. cl6col]
MRIRKATINDAEGIAKVHVDSWRTTYKGVISDDFLSKLSYKKRTDLWIKNIEKEDNFVVLVENPEGEIIGFADCGKRETVPNSGNLTSIYILKEYHGRGLGKELLRQLFLHFKFLGYQNIFVDVLEDNKTRYFYENYGAKLCDSTQIIIGGKVLNELTYEWDNIDEVIAKL